MTVISSSHVTGEDPHTGIVASVDIAAQAMVTCVEDERLEFQVCEDDMLNMLGLCSSPFHGSEILSTRNCIIH